MSRYSPIFFPIALFILFNVIAHVKAGTYVYPTNEANYFNSPSISWLVPVRFCHAVSVVGNTAEVNCPFRKNLTMTSFFRCCDTQDPFNSALPEVEGAILLFNIVLLSTDDTLIMFSMGLISTTSVPM
jgi:hypothetical protein